jgi:uncharacterized pyridoxal phosphate-containing UPF0001 family protein
MSSIAENLAGIERRIGEACARSGRARREITLIGVSKTKTAEAIREAFAAGVREFGENRVQEWEGKRGAVADLDGAVWHLIGHLQSNKAGKAAKIFDCVDSVDDFQVAERLARVVRELRGEVLGQREDPPSKIRGWVPQNQLLQNTEIGGRPQDSGTKAVAGVPDTQNRERTQDPGSQKEPEAPSSKNDLYESRLRVLIEVRVAEEETKSGVAMADLGDLTERVVRLEELELAGLMCVPPFLEQAELVRPYFARLREARDKLATQIGKALPVLSMGMSHDFEVAIEEGATEVRVGSALFGERVAKG